VTAPITTAPTQTRHPWRATARTILAAALPLIPLLPELVDVLGLRAYAWAGGIVTAAGIITRVLAVPGVNAWLARHAPALAAAPRQ
jgi:hypothetical protein